MSGTHGRKPNQTLYLRGFRFALWALAQVDTPSPRQVACVMGVGLNAARKIRTDWLRALGEGRAPPPLPPARMAPSTSQRSADVPTDLASCAHALVGVPAVNPAPLIASLGMHCRDADAIPPRPFAGLHVR